MKKVIFTSIALIAIFIVSNAFEEDIKGGIFVNDGGGLLFGQKDLIAYFENGYNINLDVGYAASTSIGVIGAGLAFLPKQFGWAKAKTVGMLYLLSWEMFSLPSFSVDLGYGFSAKPAVNIGVNLFSIQLNDAAMGINNYNEMFLRPVLNLGIKIPWHYGRLSVIAVYMYHYTFLETTSLLSESPVKTQKLYLDYHEVSLSIGYIFKI